MPQFADPLLIPFPKIVKLEPHCEGYPLHGHSERRNDSEDQIAPPAVNYIENLLLNPQAYRLAISTEQIVIESSSDVGAQYGSITLNQLIVQYGDPLPCIYIEDEPDFEYRGFMLDVSRGRVPRRETMIELLHMMRELKYNQLQLYIEHTFTFEKHPKIGEGHSPFTAEEINDLDKLCELYGIELVPNFQSFGHQYHILKIPEYADLAESDYRGGWTLSPEEEGTYELLDDLYEEFLPVHSHHKYFNVGCDETWDLGKGKSKERADKEGLGKVYLRHLLRVHEQVKKRGYRMMFWGDIIADYPELLPEIPTDVVLLNWNYEAHGEQERYAEKLAPAKRSGLEHWVCPGTSCWNSFFFRMENSRSNIRDFARAGIDAGARGLLLTNWGDQNHYNFLSWAYWSLAYGGDAAWRSDPDPDAEAAFDERFVLQMLNDRDQQFLEPLRLLGGLYQDFEVMIPNNSAERWIFTGNPVPDFLGVTGELTQYNDITREAVEKALANASKASQLLAEISIQPTESTDPQNMLRWPESLTASQIERVTEEWKLGADLAAFACGRWLFHNHGVGGVTEKIGELDELKERFSAMWLATDRTSDLENNLRDFERIRAALTETDPEKIVF